MHVGIFEHTPQQEESQMSKRKARNEPVYHSTWENPFPEKSQRKYQHCEEFFQRFPEYVFQLFHCFPHFLNKLLITKKIPDEPLLKIHGKVKMTFVEKVFSQVGRFAQLKNGTIPMKTIEKR